MGPKDHPFESSKVILKCIRGYKPLFQLFDFWGQGRKKTFQNWNARALLEHPIPQSSRAFTQSFNKHASPSVCSLLKTEKQQSTAPASRAHHLAHCLHLVDWTSWSVHVTFSSCSSAFPDQSLWSSRIWRIINRWGQKMANNLLKWLCPCWNLTSKPWHLAKQYQPFHY